MKTCNLCDKILDSYPPNRKYCGSQAVSDSCSYIANKIAQKEHYRINTAKNKTYRNCLACDKPMMAVAGARYCGHKLQKGTCAYKIFQSQKKASVVIPKKEKIIYVEGLTPRMLRAIQTEQHNRKVTNSMHIPRPSI